MKKTIVLASFVLLAGCSIDQLGRTQSAAEKVQAATTRPQFVAVATVTDTFVPGLGTAVMSLIAASAGLTAAVANRLAKAKAEGKATELSKANAVLQTITGVTQATTAAIESPKPTVTK